MRYVSSAITTTLVDERKMAFVAGARQVGKTTLARSMLSEEDAYFNWDIESHRRKILHDPERFWTGGHASPQRQRIVLDEIHKYPRWKRFLKGLFDAEGSTLEMLVTGSGRLDIYQRGGDSLLGRYALHRLHPFTVGKLVANGNQVIPTPDELGAFLADPAASAGAAEALAALERFTGFPEPLFTARDERLRRWRRVRRQLVLREDLRDLTRIREMGLVDQLVALLPERVGSPLSVNSLREDLGVAFNTVQGWLRTLERLYFLFEIRPYAGRMPRALRREGKVYLFDFSEIEAPGPRFENLVALHLLKLVDTWNDRGYGDFALHYVRDKERREVDFFIINGNKPYLLLETKLCDDDISPSLRYFAKLLRPRHVVQVVRSGDFRSYRDASVIPAAALLAHL